MTLPSGTFRMPGRTDSGFAGTQPGNKLTTTLNLGVFVKKPRGLRLQAGVHPQILRKSRFQPDGYVSISKFLKNAIEGKQRLLFPSVNRLTSLL